MSQTGRTPCGILPDWVRLKHWPRSWSQVDPENKRRVAGMALALLLEALLLLLLFTLGQANDPGQAEQTALVSFAASPDQQETPDPPDQQTPDKQKPKPAASTPPDPVETAEPMEPQLAQTAPDAAPAALIPLLRDDMPAAEMSDKKPPRPKAVIKGPMGPDDSGFPSDSPRVGGSGPNGEPLYRATWYREPYHDELAGYLSTASGPGWGLINCRTISNFRVDDCVVDGEYPQGSGIGRAVLAASWQFRVRPPRVGGRSKVGEWVRIRITYDLQRNE